MIVTTTEMIPTSSCTIRPLGDTDTQQYSQETLGIQNTTTSQVRAYLRTGDTYSRSGRSSLIPQLLCSARQNVDMRLRLTVSTHHRTSRQIWTWPHLTSRLRTAQFKFNTTHGTSVVSRNRWHMVCTAHSTCANRSNEAISHRLAFHSWLRTRRGGRVVADKLLLLDNDGWGPVFTVKTLVWTVS